MATTEMKGHIYTNIASEGPLANSVAWKNKDAARITMTNAHRYDKGFCFILWNQKYIKKRLSQII